MILFVDGILTPYQVARYNTLKERLGRPVEVWFQAQTEVLREYQRLPAIKFKYRILPVTTLKLWGQDIISVRFNRGYLNLLARLKKKTRARDRLEKIVITGWDQPICLVVLLWAKWHRVSVTLRAGSTAHEQTILRTLTKPYVKWFVSQFDDYMAYGSASAKYLVILGAKRSRIFKFYNTVDVTYFAYQTQKLAKKRTQLRAKLGLSGTSFVLLASGRFVRYKNFKLLIKVFTQLAIKYPDSYLVILGTGPELIECRRLARQLSGHVLLPGFVQQQQLSKYYAVADLFVLPSQHEVWGLVVNEAMASGLPVLVSRTAGCVPELIKKGINGLTFDPNSPADLRSKLLKLYGWWQDPTRYQRLGQNSRQIIKQYRISSNVTRLKHFWHLA